MGLIEDFIEYHSYFTDAPDLFAKLEAIFMIGSCMGNNFKNPLNVEIKHNFFVFFIAPTSRMRKSTSIKRMMNILRAVDIPELPFEVTPESLIKSLKDKPHAIYVKDEFGSELAKMSRKNSYMSNFMDVACKLWEEYDTYTRNTVGEGDIIVDNPYFSMFLATTDDRFDTYARNDFVMSGFLPRFLMVFPDDRDRKPYKPLYYPSQSTHNGRIDALETSIKHFLSELYLNEESISLRIDNVDHLNTLIQQLESANVSPTLAALYNKLSNYIIKVADVLKISDMTPATIRAAPEIIVEQEYVEKAYSLIRAIISKYRFIFENRIEWRNSELTTKRVLDYVIKQCQDMTELKLTKYDIQSASKSDAQTFTEVMDTLLQSGYIIEVVVEMLGTQTDAAGQAHREMIRKGIYVLREKLDELEDRYHVVDIIGVSREIVGNQDIVQTGPSGERLPDAY